MILSDKAIKALKNDSKLQRLLAAELDVLDVTIERMIEKNDSNERLTTVKAVAVIERETGLKQEEILIEEKFHA